MLIKLVTAMFVTVEQLHGSVFVGSSAAPYEAPGTCELFILLFLRLTLSPPTRPHWLGSIPIDLKFTTSPSAK